MHSLKAYFLPALTSADDLAGSTVVVIDVLRATTVISYALAAGARAVIPCLEIDDARRLAGGFGPEESVLAGERGGLKIEGFGLGNSPEEFTPELVGGKTLLFTTTNGTRALLRCRQARRVLIGAFANASAVVERVAYEDDVRLLCAGTRGEVTREDVLFAGLVADGLLTRVAAGGPPPEINDQFLLARDSWQAFLAAHTGRDMSANLAVALRATQGGRNLMRIGLERDIDVVAQIDRFHFVPRFDVASGKIIA